MNWEIYGLSEVINVQDLEFSMSKFIKYANHLAIEFIRNPWLQEWNKRWEKYVVRLIEECYRKKILPSHERDDFYSWEVNIEEVVFVILEVLILKGYFIAEDYWIRDSSNSISFVYAWNTYIRLWKALGEWCIDIPSMYIDTATPLKITKEQQETQTHIDTILDDEDWEYDDYMDLDEYPFLDSMNFWVSILLHPRDMWWYLEDFDYDALIAFWEEYGILDSDSIQQIHWDTKEEIIFEIFQIFYKSGFIDNIDIAEDDREKLKRELTNNYYALNMLYWDEKY